ncbi:nitrous oxide reductase accessory protein NosL [Haladaptatus sp. W1]|uniref:nitrous oxide reductase accessory protein NosL n=1 Tax=Haladaptatus sp. W1 TaxID=1897478 RepID=UPI000A45FD9A|nr:nitrous oxide reductase accessory protein NosL [Haladaptatus sp. W1]
MGRKDQSGTEGKFDRRTVLKTGALSAGIALAGCLGGGPGADGGETVAATMSQTGTTNDGTVRTEDGTEAEEGETERDDETADGETSHEDTAEGTPETPAKDEKCAVCNMKVAMYPKYNAQLQQTDGEHVHFCSTGCLVAYVEKPSQFDDDASPDDIGTKWVHDHESKELVSVADEYFVLEMNAEHVDDPMMKNPLAFSTESAAKAYVEGYDDLSTDDIVRFDAFTLETAKQYRGRFF